MNRRTFVCTAAGVIVDLCHSLRNAHADLIASFSTKLSMIFE
jgi:hypothetical protein